MNGGIHDMKVRYAVSKKSIIQYILLYFALWIHGNYFFYKINDAILIAVLTLAFLFFLFGYKKIDSKMIVFVCVLSFSLILEIIITSGSLSLSNVCAVLARYALVVLAFYYDRKKFPTRLVTIVSFLSVVSIVCWAVTQVYPQIMKQICFPYVSEYLTTYSSPLFQFRNNVDISRNSGMFNEPGLYQMILIGTLYLIVYFRKDILIDRKRLAFDVTVIIVALVTTQSATGYIGGLIILIGYLVKHDDIKGMKNRRRIVFCGLIALAFLIIFSQYLGTNSIIGKVFSRFIDDNNQLNLHLSTGLSRIVSMNADIAIALKRPFGSGFVTYLNEWQRYLSSSILDTSSCVGLTSALAVYGFPITIYILAFYIYMKSKNSKNNMETLIYVLILLNTILAQPRIDFPIFVFLSIVTHDSASKISNVMSFKKIGCNIK